MKICGGQCCNLLLIMTASMNMTSRIILVKRAHSTELHYLYL